MRESKDISPPPRAEQLEREIAAYRVAGGDRVMAHLIVDCVFDAPPQPSPEEGR